MSESEPQTAQAPQDDDNALVAPILKEFVRIEKRQVTTGRVIVRTTVETDQRVVNKKLSQEAVEALPSVAGFSSMSRVDQTQAC